MIFDCSDCLSCKVVAATKEKEEKVFWIPQLTDATDYVNEDEEQKMDDGTSSVTFPESADSSPYILAHVGSYVPAGYIMLDHSPINESSPYSKSVSSI